MLCHGCIVPAIVIVFHISSFAIICQDLESVPDGMKYLLSVANIFQGHNLLSGGRPVNEQQETNRHQMSIDVTVFTQPPKRRKALLKILIIHIYSG